MERYPYRVLAVVVPLWGATTAAAAWVARRLGDIRAAAASSLFLVAAVLLKRVMLPYPAWFKLAAAAAVDWGAGSGSLERHHSAQTGKGFLSAR